MSLQSSASAIPSNSQHSLEGRRATATGVRGRAAAASPPRPRSSSRPREDTGDGGEAEGGRDAKRSRSSSGGVCVYACCSGGVCGYAGSRSSSAGVCVYVRVLNTRLNHGTSVFLIPDSGGSADSRATLGPDEISEITKFLDEHVKECDEDNLTNRFTTQILVHKCMEDGRVFNREEIKQVNKLIERKFPDAYKKATRPDKTVGGKTVEYWYLLNLNVE